MVVLGIGPRWSLDPCCAAIWDVVYGTISPVRLRAAELRDISKWHRGWWILHHRTGLTGLTGRLDWSDQCHVDR